MMQSHRKNRPAPLNIKSFKTKLAAQHHKIDNLTQAYQNNKDSIKVSKNQLNGSEIESEQYLSSQVQDNSQNSIVILNSPDVRVLNSLSSLRKDKNGHAFKLVKVPCQNRTQSVKIKQKNEKKSGFSSDNNSLEEISEIKPIKQITFQQKSSLQGKDEASSQQKNWESNFVRNPESNSNIKHGYKLFKQKNDESFQIVQVAEQQSLFKQKQDKILTDDINQQQKLTNSELNEQNLPRFTTLKKQPNKSYQSNLFRTNHNRVHKTENHIVSPIKKKSLKIFNSQKSQKYIQYKQSKPKYQQTQNSGKFIRLDEESSRPINTQMFAVNLFSQIVNNTKSDEEQQKLKLLMKNQKNLKLKDYLRLSSLSNDTKFDRYHNSLVKNNVSNQNQQSMKKNQSKQQNDLKRSSIDKNKSVIDREKAIALIKASLQKKLQKAFQLAYKVFQEVSESKGLVENQYEDLVFMCNFHRILDDNLFKSVSLLQQLMGSFKGKRQLQAKYDNYNFNNEEAMKQFLQKMSPRKRKKPKQKQEQVNIDNLIQKMLQIFLSKPKQKP